VLIKNLEVKRFMVSGKRYQRKLSNGEVKEINIKLRKANGFDEK
jgi:HJR/Mrr/RecB family endonuclease